MFLSLSIKTILYLFIPKP